MAEPGDRRTLLVILVIAVGIPLSNVALISLLGSGGLGYQAVRLAIGALLAPFAYRGHRFARWGLGIHLLLGTVGLATNLWMMGQTVTSGAIRGFEAGIYLASAVALFASPSVRGHFRPAGA